MTHAQKGPTPDTLDTRREGTNKISGAVLAVALLTFVLGGVLTFAAPTDGAAWTPGAAALWVGAAAALLTRSAPPVTGRRFMENAAFVGWVTLCLCAFGWNIGISGQLSMLQCFYPVSLACLWVDKTRDGDAATGPGAFLLRHRRQFVAISLVAAVHLAAFHHRTTLATHLYLATLAFVASWVARYGEFGWAKGVKAEEAPSASAGESKKV